MTLKILIQFHLIAYDLRGELTRTMSLEVVITHLKYYSFNVYK